MPLKDPVKRREYQRQWQHMAKKRPHVIEARKQSRRKYLQKPAVKALIKIQRARHYQKHKKAIKDKITRWQKANPEKLRVYQKRFRDRILRTDPTKLYARHKLQRAVRLGKIVRPTSCEKCGRPCKPDGHHREYLAPYDVQFLCHDCHKAIHISVR